MNTPPQPLLEVDRLSKHYLRRHLWHRTERITAIDDASLSVGDGEWVGLVGESGSGKSTLAHCIFGLTTPTTGDIRYNGESLRTVSKRRLRQLRRSFQLVFQDPFASLNPRHTIGESVAEPLEVHGIGTSASRRARVLELFDQVGLTPTQLQQRPAELSGGQQQRAALARALVIRPRLVVLDEPVSSLDASIAAQIVNLLLRFRATEGLALLLITHNLHLARHLTTRIAVMREGRIVEMADTRSLFESPSHPYTKMLIKAGRRK